MDHLVPAAIARFRYTLTFAMQLLSNGCWRQEVIAFDIQPRPHCGVKSGLRDYSHAKVAIA